MFRRVRLLVPLVAALSVACSVEELDLSGKRCPCVEGYVCDDTRDLCVTSLPDASIEADAADAKTADVADTKSGDGALACAVRSDQRLYCTNKVPANIRSAAKNAATIVDELRTSYSWFSCWTVGERHAGGNTTWYYTLGDRDGKWGYVAAVDVMTPAGFATDPTARGFVKCP